MNWTEHVDIYCERTAVGVLAEPLNVITNLAFFAAAYAIFRKSRAFSDGDWQRHRLLVISFLAFLIGTGSSLFHLFATRWAGLMDALPIAGFIIYFWFSWHRQVFAHGFVRSIVSVVFGFVAAVVIVSLLPPLPVARSYLIPLALLFLLGGEALYRRKESLLLQVAVLFTMSLTFRYIDEPLCESFAIGTHFLWHICNGLVIYLCALALLRTSSDKIRKELVA